MKSLWNSEIDRLVYDSDSKAENENGDANFYSLFTYYERL